MSDIQARGASSPNEHWPYGVTEWVSQSRCRGSLLASIEPGGRRPYHLRKAAGEGNDAEENTSAPKGVNEDAPLDFAFKSSGALKGGWRGLREDAGDRVQLATGPCDPLVLG